MKNIVKYIIMNSIAVTKYRFKAGPCFLLRKYYCLVCGNKLKHKIEGQVIKGDSPDSNQSDFSFVDMSVSGNIHFIRSVYVCVNCDKQYGISELKKHEKDNLS